MMINFNNYCLLNKFRSNNIVIIIYKHNQLKFLIIFLFTITFLSCSKDRVLDLKQYNKLLVVNCTFNPDSTWELWLSSTLSIGEYSEYFPAINNATIQLYENDSLIGNMTNTSKGYYTLNQLPKLGKTYSVKIHAEGFDDVFAKDSIPKTKGLITEGTVEKILIEKNAPPPYVDNIYKVLPFELTLIDTKIESNFYKIQANIDVTSLDQFPQYFYDEHYIVFPKKYIFTSDKIFEPISWEQNFILYSDVALEDTIYNLSAYYTGFGKSYNNGVDVTKITPQYISSEKLNPFYNGIVGWGIMQAKEGTGEWKLEYSVELQTISESYYKYNKTRLLQQYNRTIPGSEFNNIYSNVVGGKGIFGGYQSHKIILQ